MVRFFLILMFAMALLVSCGTDKGDKGNTSKSSSSSTSRIIRKKIDRLDPKSFIEVTLDLTKESRKWHAEWRKFIQKKRQEYFASYGLKEGQFYNYSNKNQRNIRKFLEKNPVYNQMYRKAMQQDRRYRQ